MIDDMLEFKDLNKNSDLKEIKSLLNEIYKQNEIIQRQNKIILNRFASVGVEKESYLYDYEKESKYNQLNKKLDTFLKDKKLTTGQYRTLKCLLKLESMNDADLARKSKVSYSSISQWKKKNDTFKDLYKEIFLMKNS